MGSGSGSPQKPPSRRKTEDGGRMTEDGKRISDLHLQLPCKLISSVIRRPTSVVRTGPHNESDQADRAISTGKLNASWSFALTHPAYQRGGLPRLSRETSFRGGFPA